MATSDFIYAVNPDGTLKWSFEIPSVGCESCGGGSSSPVIGIDGTIYCGTKYAYIYALNPDGVLKWSLESKGGSSQSDTTIGSDGTIYYNHSHGTLAINPDGTSKWLNYVIDGKIVFDVLRYLEAATVDTVYDDEGNFKGRVVEVNRFEGSPLIDSEGTIYVADLVWPIVDSPREQFDGYLYVFNPDGTQKWIVPIESGALASSPVMDSNGIIYVSTFHGFLWAIDSGTNAGPADSPWPMHGGNQYHTGKVSGDIGPVFVETDRPLDFTLLANYPNPFNPSTTIEFSIPESGFVSLVVYDITGQRIRELVSGDITPGIHSVFWDGCDENGTVVSSGVYISKLRMGNNIETHRMMLVK